MGWRGEEKRHEVWKFTAQTSKAARVGQLLPSRCWLALEKSFAPLFRKGKRFLRTSWTLLESSSHHQLRKACDVCKRQVEHPELEVRCERKWSSPKQRGVKPREAASSASVSHCVPIGHFKIALPSRCQLRQPPPFCGSLFLLVSCGEGSLETCC